MDNFVVSVHHVLRGVRRGVFYAAASVAVILAPGGALAPAAAQTGGGTPAVTLAVRGAGGVVPALNGRVAFGEVTFGQTERKTLIVTNRSGAPLILQANGGGGNGFSLWATGVARDVVDLPALANGERRAFTLAFTPPAAGAQSATLTINYRPASRPGATTPATPKVLRSFTASARVRALTGAAALGLTVKEDKTVVPIRNGNVFVGNIDYKLDVKKTLIVTNRSGASLTLRASGGGNDFSLRARNVAGKALLASGATFTLAHRATRELELSFKGTRKIVTKAEYRTKTATFTIEDSRKKLLRRFTASAHQMPVPVPFPRQFNLEWEVQKTLESGETKTEKKVVFNGKAVDTDTTSMQNIEVNIGSTPSNKPIVATFKLHNKRDQTMTFHRTIGVDKYNAGVVRIDNFIAKPGTKFITNYDRMSKKIKLTENIKKKQITKGERATFKITFDPKGEIVTANTPDVSATFEIRELDHENNKSRLVNFTVTATTTPPVAPTPPRVTLAYDKAGETILFDGTVPRSRADNIVANLGSAHKDGDITRTFTLTNHTGDALTLRPALSKGSDSQDRFSATALTRPAGGGSGGGNIVLPNGEPATFRVTFDPKGTATDAASAIFGIQRSDGSPLLAFTASADSTATALTGTAGIRLEVKGATPADNIVVPVRNGRVSLDAVALFATGQKTLILTNMTGAVLTLRAPDARGRGGFSLEADGVAGGGNLPPLADNGRQEFRLAFKPPTGSAFGQQTATFTIVDSTGVPRRRFTAVASVIEPVAVAGPTRLEVAGARKSGAVADLGTIAKTAGQKTYAFKIHNKAAGTGLKIGQIRLKPALKPAAAAFTVVDTVKKPSPAGKDLTAGGNLDLHIAFNPGHATVNPGPLEHTVTMTVNAATAADVNGAGAWDYKLPLSLVVTRRVDPPVVAGTPTISVAGPFTPPAETSLTAAQASDDHVFTFTATAGAKAVNRHFTIYSTGDAGAWIGDISQQPGGSDAFSITAAQQPAKRKLAAAPADSKASRDSTRFALTFTPPAKPGTYKATFGIPVHRVKKSTTGGADTKGDAVAPWRLQLEVTVQPAVTVPPVPPGPLVVVPPAGPFVVDEGVAVGHPVSGVFTATRGGKAVPEARFTLSGTGVRYFTVNAAGRIVRSDVKIVPPGTYDKLEITATAGSDTSAPLAITVTVNKTPRPRVTTTGDIRLEAGGSGVRLETDRPATGFGFVGDKPAWLKLAAKTGVLSAAAATAVPDGDWAGDWEGRHPVTVKARDAIGFGPGQPLTIVLGANPAHGLTLTVAVSPTTPVPERTFGFTVAATGGGTPASVFGGPRTLAVRAASGKPGSARIARPSWLNRAALPLRVALDPLPAGFRVTGIACDAGVTPQAPDLAKGQFIVRLGMAAVTCTVSVSAADAAKVVRLTERAIDWLLDRRMDLLMGDRLDVAARFRGSGGSSGSAGPGPVGIGFTATDSRNMNASLATSLAQLRGHAQREAARRVTAGRAYGSGAPESGLAGSGLAGIEVPFGAPLAMAQADPAPRYDIWGKANYVTFTDRVSSEGQRLDYKGTALMVSLGGDVRVTDDLLVGLMGRLDRFAGKLDGPGGDADGTGWMVGPYVAARFGPDRNLFAEAHGLWGQSWNRVDPLGTYRDSFRTSRWQVSGKLSGHFDLGPVRLVPAAGVSWFSENQRAYTDRNGYRIGGRTVSMGRLQLGPVLSRDFDLGGAALTVTGGMDGIWNFARPRRRHATSDKVGDKIGNAFRGQGKLGLDLRLPSGAAVGLTGRYDGIGAKDYKAWGGQINVRIPLN